ncbi:putative stoned B-like protein [Trichinella zimbabwensis]|uniref:Putative stoned B-like protein n=1 Tax=Trichinella zimbabwensis TaxID=268475 RepID=A0A0V1HJ78_9BILA|nr:putative stoned B-like protein [Trichinella zimbabwensis]
MHSQIKKLTEITFPAVSAFVEAVADGNWIQQACRLFNGFMPKELKMKATFCPVCHSKGLVSEVKPLRPFENNSQILWMCVNLQCPYPLDESGNLCHDLITSVARDGELTELQYNSEAVLIGDPVTPRFDASDLLPEYVDVLESKFLSSAVAESSHSEQLDTAANSSFDENTEKFLNTVETFAKSLIVKSTSTSTNVVDKFCSDFENQPGQCKWIADHFLEYEAISPESVAISVVAGNSCDIADLTASASAEVNSDIDEGTHVQKKGTSQIVDLSEGRTDSASTIPQDFLQLDCNAVEQSVDLTFTGGETGSTVEEAGVEVNNVKEGFPVFDANCTEAHSVVVCDQHHSTAVHSDELLELDQLNEKVAANLENVFTCSKLKNPSTTDTSLSSDCLTEVSTLDQSSQISDVASSSGRQSKRYNLRSSVSLKSSSQSGDANIYSLFYPSSTRTWTESVASRKRKSNHSNSNKLPNGQPTTTTTTTTSSSSNSKTSSNCTTSSKRTRKPKFIDYHEKHTERINSLLGDYKRLNAGSSFMKSLYTVVAERRKLSNRSVKVVDRHFVPADALFPDEEEMSVSGSADGRDSNNIAPCSTVKNGNSERGCQGAGSTCSELSDVRTNSAASSNKNSSEHSSMDKHGNRRGNSSTFSTSSRSSTKFQCENYASAAPVTCSNFFSGTQEHAGHSALSSNNTFFDNEVNSSQKCPLSVSSQTSGVLLSTLSGDNAETTQDNNSILSVKYESKIIDNCKLVLKRAKTNIRKISDHEDKSCRSTEQMASEPKGKLSSPVLMSVYNLLNSSFNKLNAQSGLKKPPAQSSSAVVTKTINNDAETLPQGEESRAEKQNAANNDVANESSSESKFVLIDKASEQDNHGALEMVDNNLNFPISFDAFEQQFDWSDDPFAMTDSFLIEGGNSNLPADSNDAFQPFLVNASVARLGRVVMLPRFCCRAMESSNNCGDDISTVETATSETGDAEQLMSPEWMKFHQLSRQVQATVSESQKKLEELEKSSALKLIPDKPYELEMRVPVDDCENDIRPTCVDNTNADVDKVWKPIDQRLKEEIKKQRDLMKPTRPPPPKAVESSVDSLDPSRSGMVEMALPSWDDDGAAEFYRNIPTYAELSPSSFAKSSDQLPEHTETVSSELKPDVDLTNNNTIMTSEDVQTAQPAFSPAAPGLYKWTSFNTFGQLPLSESGFFSQVASSQNKEPTTDPFSAQPVDDGFAAFASDPFEVQDAEALIEAAKRDADAHCRRAMQAHEEAEPCTSNQQQYDEMRELDESGSSSPLFDEDDSEPILPFQEKRCQDGWQLMIRFPIKKKLVGERCWKSVFVRLVENKRIQVFHGRDDAAPFQEFVLQPTYCLTEILLQQFDAFGKIHATKLQHVIYKERVGLRPGQIPRLVEGQFSKLGMPLEHSAQSVHLMKFASLDITDLRSFVNQVEDCLFALHEKRVQAAHYKQDEVQVHCYDEYTAHVDRTGLVSGQKARVRIFCLAFVSGMPWVEIGLNDRRREGLEVVRRKDIMPMHTDRWIRLEQCELHECVDKDTYERDHVIRLQPLDACFFEVFRFRVRPPRYRELPLRIGATMKIVGSKIEIRIECLVTGFKSRKARQVPCEDIQIRFPIPEAWIYLFREERYWGYGSVHAKVRRPGKVKNIKDRLIGIVQQLESSIMEVAIGDAKYEHVYRSLVWRIPRLPEKHHGAYKTHLLRCCFQLTSFDMIPEAFLPTCDVEFTMPIATVSNTVVRSVAVDQHEDPEHIEKWVRYLSKYTYTVDIDYVETTELDMDAVVDPTVVEPEKSLQKAPAAHKPDIDADVAKEVHEGYRINFTPEEMGLSKQSSGAVADDESSSDDEPKSQKDHFPLILMLNN